MKIWSLLLWIVVWAPLLLLRPEKEAWVQSTQEQPTGTYHLTAQISYLSPQSLETSKGDYILIDQVQYQRLRGMEKAKLTVIRSHGTNKLARIQPVKERKKVTLVSLRDDGYALTSDGVMDIAPDVRPCNAKHVIAKGKTITHFICRQ